MILVVTVVTITVSCATSKKAISEEDVRIALCHTWTNPEADRPDKVIYYHDGRFEFFYRIDSTTSTHSGTYEIEEAWSDHEGNIWSVFSQDFGIGSGVSFYGSKVLMKISNSGTVFEFTHFSGETPSGSTVYLSSIYYRQ